MPLFKNTSSLLLLIALGTQASTTFAVDDGSQMSDPFRVNYAGYLPLAKKIGLYLAPNRGTINWQLAGTNCQGQEDTYVSNDKSSGDSFYIIDFSACQQTVANTRLEVDSDQSASFSISDTPYGDMAYEFFDYFKDHETEATFSNSVNDWASGLSVSFRYVRDAGDNGAYPTNTASAAWSLINLLETYPSINGYYQQHLPGSRSVYEQLTILTEQFYSTLSHGGPLAIPKFHTGVNASWAICTPHTSGTCISEPETKATYATARTLAAMARLHSQYGTDEQAQQAYALAKQAYTGAESNPTRCNQADSFGGEGGFYPDNDNSSVVRDPKANNDNCAPQKDNTQDDQYTARVELYLAAITLAHAQDANDFRQQVISHERHQEASSFWWGAVVMEGGLSLLSNEGIHDIELSDLKSNILNKARDIQTNQALGYPGVTWDPNSNYWDNGDQDDADNNVRWGSHRMALNDARILMAAAHIEFQSQQYKPAADFARSAILVLDHMSGINAINLAMFTAQGYPEFENAIERTHDGADYEDTWPGKLVLGPNNWTNANDSAMPEFNSLPGLKMFATLGTGWASREISIDANASLVPVAYFTTEIAPDMLRAEITPPTEPNPEPDPEPDPDPIPPALDIPQAPEQLETTVGENFVELNWRNNDSGSIDHYLVYMSEQPQQPSTAQRQIPAGTTTVTVDNLDSDTQYYFWVVAENSAGTSSPAATNARTAAPTVQIGSSGFWLTVLCSILLLLRQNYLTKREK